MNPEARRKKILIADDDPAIREILATQLKRLQYDAVTAADGAEAVAAFKSEKPDLVILDIMMPGLDGFHACEKMRASEKKGARVPILFLTARDSPHDQLSSAISGGDEFIAKPIGLLELQERVEAALARAKARRC